MGRWLLSGETAFRLSWQLLWQRKVRRPHYEGLALPCPLHAHGAWVLMVALCRLCRHPLLLQAEGVPPAAHV